MRFSSALRNSASTIIFFFCGWLAFAGGAHAQTKGAASPSEAERMMRGLTGESDADFDALMDQCIVDNGRRICPGTDANPDVAGKLDLASGAAPSTEISRSERGVTWVPGVRGELTTTLALEDRIRERLDAGAGAEALEDARRLLALAGAGGRSALRTSIRLLGDCLYASGRFGEAENQYRRALTLELPKSAGGGPGSLMATASVLGKLANVYAAQNDIPRALKLSERSVRLAGDGIDPNGAWVFYNHALLALRAQRYDEASNYLHRGADLYLRFYGHSNREGAYGLDLLGRLAMQKGDWTEAVASFRQAASIERGAFDAGRSSQNAEPDGAGAYIFLDLMAADYAMAAQEPEQRDSLLGEAFEAAQWASQKTAASALTQMAARQARGPGALAELLRHQQDLVVEWRRTIQRLTDALLLSNPEGDAEDAAALRRRVADQEREIRQTDERVAADFPGYFALIKPAPASLGETQQLLAEDETLVQFAFTEDALFVLAASRSGASWRKADLSAHDVAAQVQALRCGLDARPGKARDVLTCR